MIMIKNEKQLGITRKKLRDFETSLQDLKENFSSKNGIRYQIQADALQGDIKALRNEIKEYEKLKAGEIKTLSGRSIQDLPGLLIKARIARAMSQKELAETLGLKEQQIQRYESSNYASASLSRIVEVVQALNIRIEEKARLV